MKSIPTAIAAIAASLALAGVGAAHAQASAGNIMGEAKAGDRIVLDGADTGFHREIAVKKDGRYHLRRIPMGVYVLVQTHADGSREKPRTIRVVGAGITTRVQ